MCYEPFTKGNSDGLALGCIQVPTQLLSLSPLPQQGRRKKQDEKAHGSAERQGISYQLLSQEKQAQPGEN